MKSRLTEFYRKHKLLCLAVGGLIVANALDIISTELVMAYVKGSYEGNPYLADPYTGKLLVGEAIKLKGIGILEAGVMSLVGIAAESELVAAAPFLYQGFIIMSAATHNLLVWWKGF